MIDVTAAIIEKDGKVLAARRKLGAHLAGYWEFPGGKLEEGETPEQCLARELAEEFCIQTTIGTYVGESIYEYDNNKIVRLLAFQVEHTSGEFQLIDHDQLCWLLPEELHLLDWAPADIALVEVYQAQILTNSYYQTHAEAYCAETVGLDVMYMHQLFLEQLPNAGHILDLGCGSGRDSKAFLSAGYEVTAVEGSAEMAAHAQAFIGQPVVNNTFQQLDYDNLFDGIWACASLLHCPKSQIKYVLIRVVEALIPGGVAYLSFKWGEDETIDNKGRFFNNYTRTSLLSLLNELHAIEVIDIWDDTKMLRDAEQRWINALIKKVDNHG